LIIGIAWGLTLPLDILGGLVAPLVLAIADISFVVLLQRTLTQWLLQDRQKKRRHKKNRIAAVFLAHACSARPYG